MSSKPEYQIQVICAWCKTVLKTKPSNTPGPSHTICKSCKEDMDKQAEELKQLFK